MNLNIRNRYTDTETVEHKYIDQGKRYVCKDVVKFGYTFTIFWDSVKESEIDSNEMFKILCWEQIILFDESIKCRT